MMKIEVKSQNNSISFIFDKFKILLFEDINRHYLFNRTILNYFNKIKDSEFTTENLVVNKIFLNNQNLNLNDYSMYYVDEHFDIDNDLKLGSKSLLLEFLNVIFNDIEYDDNYINISILLNDLFNNVIENDENIRINQLLTKKMLIKLLEVEIVKNDLVTNSYDMNYDEIIIWQLKLISKISENNSKNHFILINIPYLTNSIFETIQNINANIFITTFKMSNKINLAQSVLITKHNIIDLQDEENLYKNMNCTNNNCSNIKEFKNYIITTITNKFIN